MSCRNNCYCSLQYKKKPPRLNRVGYGTINDWEARMRREALEEDLDEYEGIEDADY